jgi:hypothetical protein
MLAQPLNFNIENNPAGCVKSNFVDTQYSLFYDESK